MSNVIPSVFRSYPMCGYQGTHALLIEHDSMIIHERSDVVLNPAGVRLGAAAVHHQIEQVQDLLESVAVSRHRSYEERAILFVRLHDGSMLDDSMRECIARQLSAVTMSCQVPAMISQAANIPRTISDDIAALSVCETMHGRPAKITGTLANSQGLESFRDPSELAN